MSRRPEGAMWVFLKRCAAPTRTSRPLYKCSPRAPPLRLKLICRDTFILFVLFYVLHQSTRHPVRYLSPTAAHNGSPASLPPSTSFDGLHKDAAAVVLIRERPPVAEQRNFSAFVLISPEFSISNSAGVLDRVVVTMSYELK